MRLIFFFFLFSFALSAQNNIVKTVGYSYTNGTPTYTPAKAGSALALDTTMWRYYTWNGSSWLSDGFRVQTISGCSAPGYMPTKFQSHLVINACTVMQGGPELYYWNGSVWLQINDGQTYTAGTGIDITGNVISATGTGTVFEVSDSASFRSFSETDAEVVILTDINRGGTFAQCVSCTADQYMVFTDASARKWQRVNYETVDIRWFGASQNNVNANGFAFREALKLSPTLFIPSGTWKYDSTIVLKEGQSIFGENMDSSVIQYIGVNWGIRAEERKSYSTLQNFTLTGKGVSSTGILGGIYLRNNTYVYFDNVIIDGHTGLDWGDNILMEGIVPYNIYSISMRNVKSSGAQGWALHIKGNYTGALLSFRDCSFQQSGQGYNGNNGNVYMECDASFVPWGPTLFDNCNFQGSSGNPFICEGASVLTLKHCYWEQNTPVTRPAIRLGRAPWNAVGATYVTNFSIDQCNIGIDSVAAGLGIIEVATDCYVKGDISKCNVTAPKINLAPFLNVSSTAKINLDGNIYETGVATKNIVSGSSNQNCILYHTSYATDNYRIKTTAQLLAKGESTIRGQEVVSVRTDTSFVIESNIELLTTDNVYSQKTATFINTNGLRIKDGSNLFFQGNNVNIIANTSYSGNTKFKFYDYFTTFTEFGNQNAINANKFLYPTELRDGGFNQPAATFSNSYVTQKHAIINVRALTGYSLFSVDTFGLGRFRNGVLLSKAVPDYTTTPSYLLDVDGTVSFAGNPVRIKGLLPGSASDSLLTIQSGVVKRMTLEGIGVFNANHTATGTATTAFTVTLPTTQPDATYSVSIMPKNALSATGWYISARTTTTFTVTYLTGLTGAVDFDYIIVN